LRSASTAGRSGATLRREPGERRVHDRLDRLAPELVEPAARLHARPVEQAVDEAGEARRLVGDDLERLGLAVGVLQPPELQGLDEHPDRGERRAQVVRDLVHEVGLQLRDARLAGEHRDGGRGAGDGGHDEGHDEPAEQVVARDRAVDEDQDPHRQHERRGDEDEADDERQDAAELHGTSRP
jgi:hypothetical protein